MDVNINIFKQEGIEVAPWPTNSPNLNLIELYQGYEKDILKEYDIGGTTVKELQILKGQIKDEFINKMGPFIEHVCKGFRYRLKLYIAKKGNNNFFG